MNKVIQTLKTKTITLIALALTICFMAIACGDGGSTQALKSISPELAVDYVHNGMGKRL